MKQAVLTALILILVSAMTFGVELPFLEEHYQPRSIIAAFSAEAIGNRYGEIEFSRSEDGIVITQIESFDRLANEYRIVDLVQMHDRVTHLDWNDNGVYLQNIYRLVLESNDNIEKAQAALVKDKNFLFVEYESINRPLYEPNDPDYYLQWHHPVIQSSEAWDYVQGSSEIIVSITDTGVKWNHPDLADNIWINEAELPGITIDWANGLILGGDGIDNDGNGYIDDVIGWDFVEANNNPYQAFPGNTHGTHVAGCTGAVGDNNDGLTGVAMNVSLMVCKGAPSNAPSGGVQHAYQQVQYSAQSGAHIINCSWIGQGNGSYPNSVVNYATSLGSLVIAGAGNNGIEHTPGNAWFPSDADNAMSVAATDSDDNKAGFSDYGLPIDIAAPGVNIWSTYYNNQGENSYQASSGTSMASPVASGVAALVKTLHPDMAPLDLRDRLMMTADYIDDQNPAYAGLLGAGRVNAYKATMFDKIPELSIYNVTLQEHSGDGDSVPNPGEEIDLILGLYNEIYWLTAADITATLTSDLSDIDILISEVSYPNIDGGSIVFNTHQPFRFSTPDELSDLTIPFTLTIVANENSDFPFVKAFNFTATLSLQQANWPMEITGSSTSSAALIDIDGSGTKEIVFGDTQGNLQVLNQERASLPGFPVNLGSNINSAVAVSDLNNSGSAEIVANSQSGLISCLDGTGEIIFQYNAGGQFRSNPMILDVNNDGYFEIVALTFTNPRLIILKHDGTDFPGFPVSISGPVLSSPSSADLNGDGHKEIIFSTSTGNLHAISAVTGEDLNGWPVSTASASWSGPIAGDVTGNNQPDVVVANVQGNIFCFDRQGNEIFTRNIGNQIRSGIVVHDIDDDGNNEIVFADMGGNIVVLDGNGDNWGLFPVNTGYVIEHTPVLADMDGDGNLDIIYGDNGGYLRSLNISGNETPNFPIKLASGATASPAIGYIGGNNNPDIVIPTGNLYNFIDFKRPIGTIGWGHYKGSIRRTGNSFDLTGVESVPDEIAGVTELLGNYPNPFNPDTRISFSLATESDVTIKVYNIRGQLVRRLLSERLGDGEHRVIWNGKDDQGNNVSSGLYFYILQAGNYSASSKMLLLK